MKPEIITCWHCNAALSEYSLRKLSFRATCDKCLAWQHCCKNCANYQPGRPNDCLIPGTGPIADREACNYCDEFVLRKKDLQKTKSAADVASSLFGEEDFPPKKNPLDQFGSLFKED